MNKMGIAPEKSLATLFTPWTSQVNAEPQTYINNIPVPTIKRPKILGVTFDPLFTFTPHVTEIAGRASSRFQVLKALTGTSWGQDKETILLTFKAIIKPVLSYAAPIWFPVACQSNIDKLQRIQNQALQIATGCIFKSNIQHLHSESEVLPLSDHLSMPCSQFLAGALRPTNPSLTLVTQDPGPKPRTPLLQSAFHQGIAEFLGDDRTADPASHHSTISSIHTASVAAHLANRTNLQHPPGTHGQVATCHPP